MTPPFHGRPLSDARPAAPVTRAGTIRCARTFAHEMTSEPTRYSVLDLAPIGVGFTAADALRTSRDLVTLAERLGYFRHWVAEHHNMPGIASSSPAVLIEHL